MRISGFIELRELDCGISGRTVLARHETTGDEVLVRYVDVLPRGLDLLSAVESPYLARVRELVEQDRAVVLEWPRAVPLRALLAYQGVVTAEAALLLLRGSLCGLAAAHAAGVVHRGYRPEAVLVGLDGQVRLIDFGLVPHRPEASAAADIHAAVAVFVALLIADVTRTTPADLIAVTPVTLRELVRAGLRREVDMVALLASLDEVATAQYGRAWAERGRLWLALRARELWIEELRATVRGAQDAGAGEEGARVPALLAVEEQRLRAMRGEELRVRAEWAEELRASGLPAVLAVQPLPAPAWPAPGAGAKPAPRATAQPVERAPAQPVPRAPAQPATRAPAKPRASRRTAGPAAPHPVDARGRRRGLRRLLVTGGMVVCAGLFAVWLSAGQGPANAGGTTPHGRAPQMPAPQRHAPARGGPGAGAGPIVSSSPSPPWSPIPTFSYAPDQGKG